MITGKRTYPYHILQYEWERIYPWVPQAFEEIDRLFHIKETEFEVYFDQFGIHIDQRGKFPTFSYDSNLFPTIKERYTKACIEVIPYVPEAISNKIRFICKQTGNGKDIEDLNKLWLQEEKEFVVAYLYELVDSANLNPKKSMAMKQMLVVIEC